MDSATLLSLDDRLPLTCTRSGTCCHGKHVWVSPWEVACLARALGISPRALRERALEAGGIRLRMDGASRWRELPACALYVDGHGCSAHAGRPLACRLYPLGRQLQAGDAGYFHHGSDFPCLDGCPSVVTLPYLSVAEYLAGQGVAPGQAAQAAGLELVQHLADGAFVLLLESGLAASGDRKTLRRWRALGVMTPEERAAAIPTEWLDRLTVPDLDPALIDEPRAFVARHEALLQAEAQARFASLSDAAGLRDASSLMLALALHLARALGAEPHELTARWVATAKSHGAQD
ncbi:MAG: YkgJ family cysteine cluster protein [Myxococcota bacterium]